MSTMLASPSSFRCILHCKPIFSIVRTIIVIILRVPIFRLFFPSVLKEQSDQGLHCLQAYLHLLGALLSSSRILLNAVSCLSVLCHKTELNSTKVYAANAPATDA